ncbi:MAG: ribulose-phosphate 3-epimerase [Hungatella sp.]|nr:ribulose-phosphate 3-epimerase [Hungatella sp.]
MQPCISASIMCADLMNMEYHLKELERCGCEYIHVDIMDGVFVPNYTLGTDFIRQLHQTTKIPLDLHLMVEAPEDKLDYFELFPEDVVSIHVESTRHLQKALSKIRKRGAKASAALNPATPVCYLDYLYDDLDMVLVMTVNPGFAGQKMIPSTLEKITQIKKRLTERGRRDVPVEADGNVSFENAVKMAKAGADIFVAGTSSIYRQELPFEDCVKEFRKAILAV